MEITREIAAKVLSIVDAGLVAGVGEPIPGKMCVEAAVCFALGQPHGDEPDCVDPVLRSFKIGLNDAGWSSSSARAKGLRRIALAQLGSAGALDQIEFVGRLSTFIVRSVLPPMLQQLAEVIPQCAGLLTAAADKCAADIVAASAASAYSAASAADIAADIVADIAADIVAASVARAASVADIAAARAAARAARAAARTAASAASVADIAASVARTASVVADSAARAAGIAADSAARAASVADIVAASVADIAAASVADIAAASVAARAADIAAARAADSVLFGVAEGVVQILIAMNAPGCVWLDLAPLVPRDTISLTFRGACEP